MTSSCMTPLGQGMAVVESQHMGTSALTDTSVKAMMRGIRGKGDPTEAEQPMTRPVGEKTRTKKLRKRRQCYDSQK